MNGGFLPFDRVFGFFCSHLCGIVDHRLGPPKWVMVSHVILAARPPPLYCGMSIRQPFNKFYLNQCESVSFPLI